MRGCLLTKWWLDLRMSLSNLHGRVLELCVVKEFEKVLNNKLLSEKIKKIRSKYFVENNKVLAENVIKKNFKNEKLLG